MNKQLAAYEGRKGLSMCKNRIQKMVCLALCLLLMLGVACAKVPSVVAPASNSWEDRLTAYLDSIAQKGYTVSKKEHTSSDYGSEFDNYCLSNPNMEEGSEYVVQITTNKDGRRYISVSVENSDFRAINQENIGYLMQTMVQVCDPSIANNEKEVEKRVKDTFRKEQTADDFVVNGVNYHGGMYSHSIMFIAMDPNDDAGDESASAADLPAKPLAFTKDEWIGWFETVIQPLAVTLKEGTAAEASDADLKDMVVPDQTEVYTLEHQLGITIGWILFDSTEQGLCQIRFVKKAEDISSYLGGDIKEAVVRACDPDFRTLPIGEKNEIYSDFCGDLWKTSETKERNGITYETDPYGNGFTVRVS